MNKNSIYVGTSGWSYGDWRGGFYPQDLKTADFLTYYSKHFNTVEVNTSFYHTLRNTTIDNWIAEVPRDFIFSVKADRYITHIKKLENPEQTVPNFMQSIKPFKTKLGPILFQLPPSFKFNKDRLKAFVNVLPDDFLYVLEFRNNTWFNEETYKILREKNIALCIYNLKGYQSPLEITADFTYIRNHGTLGIGVGEYSKGEINKLAKNITKFVSQKKKVYCYFNNGAKGAAITNANLLKSSLQH